VVASLKLLAVAEQVAYRDLYRDTFPAGGEIDLVNVSGSADLSALEQSVSRHRPDVLLLSVINLDADVAVLLTRLHRDFPELAFVASFLFYQPDDLRALRPLVVGAATGAALLLNHAANPDVDLLTLVRAVSGGEVYIDPALTSGLLSDREPASVKQDVAPVSGSAATRKRPDTAPDREGGLVVYHLMHELRDLNYDVREAAARVLGERRDLRALPALIEILRDGHCFVRVAATRALGNIGNARAVAPLAVSLKDEDWEVRAGAAWALGEMGVRRAEGPLAEAMSDPNWVVKRQAAESLRKLRSLAKR